MTATTAEEAAPATAKAAKPLYSERYTNLVLFLLAVAYAINFVDRSIITILGQAIKADLKITDTQLGLLGGLYFALLYTVLGIPIARLAERYSRVSIIAVAMVVWSGFTVACGTAANYLMLSIYRFGVGVGEAGLAPPAHSLISDYVPSRGRARALAIFSAGVPVGTMTGAIAGGWLATHFSWRIAFMVVGLPGILVAVIIKLLMKEPARGHVDIEAQAALAGDIGAPPVPRARATLAGEFREIGEVIRLLFGQWPVANVLIALSLVTCAGFGVGQFAAPYYVRAFGLSFAQVGLIVGLIGGTSAIIGTFIGGVITDRMAKIHPAWYALTPCVALVLAFPFHVAIYNAGSWQAAAVLLAFPGLLSGYQLSSSFAVAQNISPVRQRATATAILMFVMNLVGMGLGPPLAGWIIDHYAAFHLAHPQMTSLWDAIQHLFRADAPFKIACPGGSAPKTADAAAKAACHTALVLGTRHGILTMFGFSLWGGLHYALGGIGMKAAMAKARALRGDVG